MQCKICKNEFIPNKYRPKQQVCSALNCQRLRQLQNIRDWQGRNPDYFKFTGPEASWHKNRLRYARLWRDKHKEHIKEYLLAHRQQRREYMREYMRKHREAKSVNRNKI